MQYAFFLNEIPALCESLWQYIQKHRVVVFDAEMGAGKTTLIKFLCKHKNVKNVVNSPTYSIVNEYVFEDNEKQKQKIYHLDLYRLKNEDEVFEIGLSDILASNHFCFIEWAEKALFMLPQNYIIFKINIDFVTQKRILTVVLPTV